MGLGFVEGNLVGSVGALGPKARIPENRPRSPKIAHNRPKSPRMGQNRTEPAQNPWEGGQI